MRWRRISLVAEAAVVGMPHEMKAMWCVRHAEDRMKPSDGLKRELVDIVAKQIGSLAKPDQIRFTQTLPSTRSGSIS